MIKRTIVLAGFVLALAPSVASADVARGAVFNDPQGSPAAQQRITNTVISYINAAKPGSAVRASMMSLTSQPFASALVRAKRKGVRVQVVAERGHVSKIARRVLRPLGHRFEQVSPSGPSGLLHAKFFLFTNTGDTRHVSIIASANMTVAQNVVGYNDAFVSTNARIHRLLVHRFNGIKHNYDPNVPDIREGDTVLNQFPRPRETDPMAYLIGNVKSGSIDMDMLIFYRVSIAQQLARKAAKGIRVRVICREISPRALEVLTEAGIPVRALPRAYWNHSKYLVARGQIRKTRRHGIVMLGSANATYDVFDHEELSITTDKPSTTADYARHFNWMLARTSPLN